ncbi:MFS transporter [Actinomadura opuntiae]|uniref:MFS transporter n=1 Tax=Actinomadura sp. OS1-43 TaxID=604315 RepID=UPI00255A83CB|nr:MFS transporter [Actinomadura sp. OS1-43]MDL4816549.1 MFS transporter [Actinomadura sp. OS1-43]
MSGVGARTAAARASTVAGDFRRLWLGQSVSMVGDQVALFTLPTVAILTLHGGSLQVGALRAVGTLAYPLLGLPAGAMLERRRRRPAMVVADLVRCAAFLSIPLAVWRDSLTMVQLYVVAAVAGVFAVVFDIASQTYLPLLLPPERLAVGNARMELSSSVSRLAGAPLGGVLSQFLSAAGALGANGLSFLASVLGVTLIRAPEPRTRVHDAHESVLRRIATGLRVVRHDRLLLPLTLAAAVRNFGMTIVETVLLLLLYRPMHLSAGQAGAVLAAGAVAAVLGALLCTRFTGRFGLGTTLVVTGLEGAVWLLTPASLVLPGPVVVVVLLFVSSLWLPVWNAGVTTLRQSIVPPELLGRVHATARTINLSVIPLGALAGGALAAGTSAAMGDRTGLILTVMLGGAVSTLSGAIVLCSDVRDLKSSVDPRLTTGT